MIYFPLGILCLMEKKHKKEKGIVESHPEEVPKINPQEDLETRVRLFNQDFVEIQKKYKLKAIGRAELPGGVFLEIPIQLIPTA